MKPFLLFVIDWNAKRFSVEGPMLDDTPWVNAVVAAQGAGRNVTCCTASQSNAQAAAESWRAEHAHELAESGSIVIR